jgi:hypothetical protein
VQCLKCLCVSVGVCLLLMRPVQRSPRALSTTSTPHLLGLHERSRLLSAHLHEHMEYSAAGVVSLGCAERVCCTESTCMKQHDHDHHQYNCAIVGECDSLHHADEHGDGSRHIAVGRAKRSSGQVARIAHTDQGCQHIRATAFLRR